MYLSRVFIQPGKLNNAYEWHRALWSLFPDVERGAASPFLYHMESINLATGAQVLMQSSMKPIANSVFARLMATKPFIANFQIGQPLIFQLLANPIKCISNKHDKVNKKNQGKCRVPLIKEQEQSAWLERKFSQAVNMNSLNITNHTPLYFRKGNRAGKIVPVHFEGIIEVNDVAKMDDVWRNGIGPAKAFGCGLLLVRRA